MFGTKAYETWAKLTKTFLRDKPDLIANPTKGYIRFLQWQGVLPNEVADEMCRLVALKNFCPPETFTRARRELLDAGRLYLPPAQAQAFEELAGEARTYFSKRKQLQ